MSKPCSKCKKSKPLTDFHKNSSSKDGLLSRCKECIRLLCKEYRERNYGKEKQRHSIYQKENPEKIRNLRLKSEYGITLEEYNVMLRNQKERCAICQVHRSKLNRSLCVDHDHSTKKVRGLLCPRCNKGLGSFKDSFVLVKRAFEYLISSLDTKVDVLSLDRRAFLTIVGLSSHILDILSDEIETLRTDKNLPKDVRMALRQMAAAHIKSVATLGHAISNCVVDPTDLEGTRLSELN